MQIYLPIAEVSVNGLVLFVIGTLVGLLSGMFGVGGGFILTPLLFFIGIPPAVAVASATTQILGTSVFQFLFVTGITAVLHAVQSGTVDVLLALILLVGGVIGAQVGVVLAARLRAEQLRVLLALLVLGVCLKLFGDLVIRPGELFSLAG